MASEEVQLVLEEGKAAMDKSVGSFQSDIAKLRTGRANPALLDGIIVDYYGTPTALRKLATVSVPEPRLLTIQPFDPKAAADIERAILKSDLGLTPKNDGKLVRVPIPELTEERRRDLVKHMKKIAEEHKKSIRGARRDSLSLIKDLEKEGQVDEDESHRAQKSVQDLTDQHCARIDELATKKEQEILTV
jgi:ribosome recycling factor